MTAMNAADIRTWAANFRAAANREREELRRSGPLPPEVALRFALDLLAFDEAQNGSPFEREDRRELREDAAVRDAWALLRSRWRDGR